MNRNDVEYRRGDRQDVLIWFLLLVCLGATVAVSFADWGPWSTALSFLISAAKTLLIAYFYMHLRHEKGMTRIFALAGAAWLVVLFSLTLSDYVSRDWIPYPTRWPIFVQLRPALNDNYGPDQQQAPRPGDFGVGR